MPIDPGTAFLASQGGGALLSALSELFSGGGQRRRVRTAERSAGELFGTQFNPANIARQRQSFQGALGGSEFFKNLAGTASRRVGLGSGIGQQFIMQGAQQRGAEFESGAIRDELERVLRQRLAGAGLQGQLAG